MPSVASQLGATGVAVLWIVAALLLLRGQRTVTALTATVAALGVAAAGLVPGFAWIALTHTWGAWLVVQDATAPMWPPWAGGSSA